MRGPEQSLKLVADAGWRRLVCGRNAFSVLIGILFQPVCFTQATSILFRTTVTPHPTFHSHVMVRMCRKGLHPTKARQKQRRRKKFVPSNSFSGNPTQVKT